MMHWIFRGYLKAKEAKRKRLVVEHVRYVKRDAPDPVEKARQMCRDMGREIPEAIR